MSNYKQMELIKSTELSADCLVSPTQLQDLEQAIKTLAHYTPTISDCFAQLDLDGHWLKTSQGYCQLTMDELYEEYLAPLPPTGMMRSGNLYHAPKLVAVTKESDCLLLPTPKHTDKNTAGVRSHKQGQTKHLSVAVRYRLKELGYDNEGFIKGYLNPKFVEMMMGFPVGWTDKESNELKVTSNALDPSLLVTRYSLLKKDRLNKEIILALTSLNSKQNRIRLGQLGNAIVPQVGAVMFDLLGEILNKVARSPHSRVNKEQVAINYVTPPVPRQVAPLVNERSAQHEADVKPKETCYLLSATCSLSIGSTIVDNHDKLSKLEEIIEKEAQGLKSFREVAIALTEIRDQKLHKIAGHSTFLGYCYSKFNLSKARVYQLINAAKVIDLIEKSTIVDIDLSGYEINEFHCRELAKIKNPDERSLVLQKVISEGTVTAKAIGKTYKAMKLKDLPERNYSDLLPIGTVVRLTTKTHPDYQKYNGYWGIVTEVYEFSVAIQVINDLLLNVHPYSFLVIGEVEGALSLLERLAKIERSPDIDITVRELLKAIATNSYPELTEWQKRYLDFTEKLLDRS